MRARLGERVLTLGGFGVALQGQEGIAEVVLTVALLNESVSVLSLEETHRDGVGLWPGGSKRQQAPINRLSSDCDLCVYIRQNLTFSIAQEKCAKQITETQPPVPR